jgi:hypothetical protein
VRYELGSYIQEDGILHSHRRGNLKPDILITGYDLISLTNPNRTAERASLQPPDAYPEISPFCGRHNTETANGRV